MRLQARLTQVIRQVPQVWFDHSWMEIFVVSEELQVSGVVLEISLRDSSDIWSEKVFSEKVRKHLRRRAASTYFKLFWIQQLLLDLLQPGLSHCLLGHRAHGVLHTDRASKRRQLYITDRKPTQTRARWSTSSSRMADGPWWRTLTRHLYLKPSISSILNSYGFNTLPERSKKQTPQGLEDRVW